MTFSIVTPRRRSAINSSRNSRFRSDIHPIFDNTSITISAFCLIIPALSRISPLHVKEREEKKCYLPAGRSVERKTVPDVLIIRTEAAGLGVDRKKSGPSGKLKKSSKVDQLLEKTTTDHAASYVSLGILFIDKQQQPKKKMTFELWFIIFLPTLDLCHNSPSCCW